MRIITTPPNLHLLDSECGVSAEPRAAVSNSSAGGSAAARGNERYLIQGMREVWLRRMLSDSSPAACSALWSGVCAWPLHDPRHVRHLRTVQAAHQHPQADTPFTTCVLRAVQCVVVACMCPITPDTQLALSDQVAEASITPIMVQKPAVLPCMWVTEDDMCSMEKMHGR